MRHGLLSAVAGIALLGCLPVMPAMGEVAASAASVAQPAEAAGGAAANVHAVKWVRRHVRVRHVVPRRPVHPTRKALVGKAGQAPLARDARGLEDLRNSLMQRLGRLNAPVPAAPGVPGAATSGPAGAVAVATVQAQPRPACAPSFAMTGWKGSGGFNQALAARHRDIAEHKAAAAALTRLAELYLGYGLPAEALEVSQEAQGSVGSPADQQQAMLDADLARLLLGQPIAAASPLLTDPPDCNRPDKALWQALAAAATRDAPGFAAAAKPALDVLPSLPEPILEQAAFRLADATEDQRVLVGLANALRNTDDADPTEQASHLLLQARIAKLRGDTGSERELLADAARRVGTVPGLRAEAQLAALDSLQPGPDTIAEVRLADIARVYRDDAIGQLAAAYLAERRLRQGRFGDALAIADQSARSEGEPRLDSRGAAIVARILRMLLVNPQPTAVPSAGERIALFLRYQGYATPGPKGDDIRLSAAQLLLAQDLPATALDVLRQLVQPAASTPPALAARAMAEALAGDPATALAMAHAAPPSDAMQRAAAEALARLGRPADAEQELLGLTAIPDRLRRAALLCDAKDWGDAAGAYADLLRDPALAGAARQHALDRYAFALALAGGQPVAPVAMAADGVAAEMIAALPPVSSAAGADGKATVAAARAAVVRARHIESLLPATNASQGS